MPINHLYRHYKGGIYTLLHIAQSESDGSQQAVYRGADGKIWVRPMREFLEKFSEVKEQGTDMQTSIIIIETDSKISVAIQSDKPLPNNIEKGTKVDDFTQYLAITAVNNITDEVGKINEQLKELRDKNDPTI